MNGGSGDGAKLAAQPGGASPPCDADVPAEAAAARWHDALTAARLLAVDPHGLGGALLHGGPSPAREAWLATLRRSLPPSNAMRRMPSHIDDERLLGGLDLGATLRAGRPVARRGLLAEADGGVVVVAMAERLAPGAAARLRAVLDVGEVVVQRDGIARCDPARVALVALDESRDDDDRMPASLAERLAFAIDLDAVGRLPVDADDGHRACDDRAAAESAGDTQAARARLRDVQAGDDIAQALTEAALALGIASIRAPLLALRVARVAAALDGRTQVEATDAALAARLVLAPRATALPAPPEAERPPADEPPAAPPPDETSADDADRPPPPPPPEDKPLDEVVLEAAIASLPADLLARLAARASRSAASGRSQAQRSASMRGRPLPSRRGELRDGVRLDLLATLRAAVPWQRLRREAGAPSSAHHASRIQLRPSDFHVARFRQRSQTTTVFVVDASGSSALHRLAEAKGAVELLLADCYVRRDRVALITFRGTRAELVLPPTRSLVRVKRSLAGLPGGGGTPLAGALDATRDLLDALARHGDTAVVVLLTDGRANVARDGTPGRAQAHDDAIAAAKLLRTRRTTTLLLDTSPSPQPQARELAAALDARYLPLPHADAARMSRAVTDASAAAASAARRT